MGGYRYIFFKEEICFGLSSLDKWTNGQLSYSAMRKRGDRSMCCS